jgi:hypothetical protein
MPIDVEEIVLDGIYATPDDRERIVRRIVNGKVFYDHRAQNTAEEWSAGHRLADAPSMESFAAQCLRCSWQPARYASVDSV